MWGLWGCGLCMCVGVSDTEVRKSKEVMVVRCEGVRGGCEGEEA